MATRLPDRVGDIVRDTERTLDELDKGTYAEALHYTVAARARAEHRVAELATLVTMISSDAGRIEVGLQRLAAALDGAGVRLREAADAPVLESKHPQIEC